MHNIQHENILPIPKSYSDNLHEITEMLLSKEADLRPSVNELLEMEIVKEKFEEYRIYETEASLNYNSSSSNLNNTTANTPNSSSNVAISLTKMSSYGTDNTKIQDTNNLEIEIEISGGGSKKRTNTSISKKKSNLTNNISSINDSSTIQSSSKIFPQEMLAKNVRKREMSYGVKDIDHLFSKMANEPSPREDIQTNQYKSAKNKVGFYNNGISSQSSLANSYYVANSNNSGKYGDSPSSSSFYPHNNNHGMTNAKSNPNFNLHHKTGFDDSK